MRTHRITPTCFASSLLLDAARVSAPAFSAIPDAWKAAGRHKQRLERQPNSVARFSL